MVGIDGVDQSDGWAGRELSEVVVEERLCLSDVLEEIVLE